MISKEPLGVATKCRSCNADIVWVRTVTGKLMPIDLMPSVGGTFGLHQDGGETFADYVGEPRRADFIGKLHVSHFSTCPNADQHRKVLAPGHGFNSERKTGRG